MNKEAKFYIVVIIVSIPLIIYLIRFYKKESRLFDRLENIGVVDTALIVRGVYGAKRTLYYEYQFFVNDKKFNGFHSYSPSNGPLNIGDSVLVKYLPEDPDEINRLILEKDYHIIKVGRNKNR